MRRILAAAALTLVATLTQCGESPRGGGATPCPTPDGETAAFAGTGEVTNKQHRRPSEGCAEKWWLQVQEFSSGRTVWFSTSEAAHAQCKVGNTWKSSFFGSKCE